eukprot:403344241
MIKKLILILSALSIEIAFCDIAYDNFFGLIGADDAKLDFYSVDFPEKCISTLPYFRVNNQTLSGIERPPIDFFQFSQNRNDPTVYDTEYLIKDPINDQYASKIDYSKNPRVYLGASYGTDRTYLQKPQHHYSAEAQIYDRPQLCQFALRLTQHLPNSKGSITTKDKQLVAFGFETEFSVQILHPSKECVSTVCRENYGTGFAFIIQNLTPNIDSLTGIYYDNGMGFDGVPGQSLVIKFDFITNYEVGNPTYPHVSVVCKQGQTQNDHQYSLGFAYLPKELSNTQVHNIKISYLRKLNRLDFRQQNFQFSEYAANMMYDTTSDWFDNYEIGLIQIYVDDLEFPVLSTLVNLAYCVNTDTHQSLNSLGVVDPTMAGKSYLSITSTTNDDQFGAFQILRFTHKGIPQCPITQIKCSNTKDQISQSFLKITLMNIGTEKMYLKFKYSNAHLFTLSEWFDCRQPIQDEGNYDDTEVKIETSMFQPYEYGCKIDVFYDGTVDDIILHDIGNTTWNSITNEYGTFENSFLLINEIICAEKINGEIKLTTCTSEHL